MGTLRFGHCPGILTGYNSTMFLGRPMARGALFTRIIRLAPSRPWSRRISSPKCIYLEYLSLSSLYLQFN